MILLSSKTYLAFFFIRIDPDEVTETIKINSIKVICNE